MVFLSPPPVEISLLLLGQCEGRKRERERGERCALSPLSFHSVPVQAAKVGGGVGTGRQRHTYSGCSWNKVLGKGGKREAEEDHHLPLSRLRRREVGGRDEEEQKS